jgi:hypothetical protein
MVPSLQSSAGEAPSYVQGESLKDGAAVVWRLLTPRSPAALVAAHARKLEGVGSMNDNFETRELPLSPSHVALDHIRDAINSIVNWQRDAYYVPSPADLAELRSVCAAFGYGRGITAFVLGELDDRLAGKCEEIGRAEER